MKHLYSKQPTDIVESFLYLRHTVQTLEKQAQQGEVQSGFFRRAYSVQGLPVANRPGLGEVPCLEYLTHGSVDDLPRQVRYGYRASNGYSEVVTYRDKFWTREGHVSYQLEISVGRSGLVKRSESYHRNGEPLSTEVTRIQAPGRLF